MNPRTVTCKVVVLSSISNAVSLTPWLPFESCCQTTSSSWFLSVTQSVLALEIPQKQMFTKASDFFFLTFKFETFKWFFLYDVLLNPYIFFIDIFGCLFRDEFASETTLVSVGSVPGSSGHLGFCVCSMTSLLTFLSCAPL